MKIFFFHHQQKHHNHPGNFLTGVPTPTAFFSHRTLFFSYNFPATTHTKKKENKILKLNRTIDDIE